MTSARTIRNLEAMERMPRALRECVQEFGSQIVNELMVLGVSDPEKIRRVVYTCWIGARQPQQRLGGAENTDGRRQSSVADLLDWVLIQAGSPVSAATILRLLWLSGMVIVMRDPSLQMIEASMATISGFDQIVSKREKHRRRLREAIDAGARHLWPSLYRESDAKKAERARLKQEIA